jgi:hypothetical protein
MTARSAIESAHLASPPHRAQKPSKLVGIRTLLFQTGPERTSIFVTRSNWPGISPGWRCAARFQIRTAHRLLQMPQGVQYCTDVWSELCDPARG